ncbi:MAG TPA: YraN family protein [Kiloniellales bacterium]|nr:YraN family protein [Kiloniellales bacterium]
MKDEQGLRRAAYRRGRRAERLAAWWLRLKGYRILAAGWRSRLGEIDLVAMRGPTIAFVEVKRREEEPMALQAVTLRQRERIARAARLYIQKHPELAGHSFRFDALLLCRGRLPRHLPDAWRESS